MNNLENLTRVNMNEDETKSTHFQNSAGNLHTISQICLTDKDMDQVLAEYSDSIKNMIKSESEDLLSTILDSLDQEQHALTPEVVTRTYHDPDNIFSNGTMINELIDVDNTSLNTTQNLNPMEDIINKGAPTFQKDQEENILNTIENNKEISEFIEISVPVYDTVNNDETLKEESPDTTENPFKDFDIEIDESIYAFGLGIAKFVNDTENDDHNYNQMQNATDVVHNTDMIHIDFEKYIPVYAHLNTAQTINQIGDASRNLRSGNTTQKDSRSFRKEANLQTTSEMNVADNAIVGLQHHCEDNNIKIKPDVITLSYSSDLSSSDEDDIPISRFKECIKNNKPLFGITNKFKTRSIDFGRSDMDDDSCNGYHSSDFEFISETEAEMGGIISAIKDIQMFKEHPKKAQTATLEKLPGASTEMAKIQNNQALLENPNMPGPRNASQNYYSPCENRNEELRNRDNNYRVPEGDDYLALFQGIHDPNIISVMENKSIYCSAIMHLEFEGVGFDMQVMNERNKELHVDDEYKKEANKTSKMVMQMYPDANKKHRRRRF